MKLVIKPKASYDESFIKYLKSYMYDAVKNDYNHIRASRLSSELNLNILDILLYAIRNMSISSSSDEWVIETNKSLRYKEFNLEKLINFITYGNIKIKGYKILYKIFENVANNIDVIYKEWLNGS